MIPLERLMLGKIIFVGVAVAAAWAAGDYIFTGEVSSRFVAGGIGASVGSYLTLFMLTLKSY